MYLKSAHIQNLKCLEDIELVFSRAEDAHTRLGNWNVILGNNGFGKSTLLQALAAVLMDASTANKIKGSGWPRLGSGWCRVEVEVAQEQEDTKDGKPFKEQSLPRRVGYTVAEPSTDAEAKPYYSSETLLEPEQVPDWEEAKTIQINVDFLKRHNFGTLEQKGRGWMACGYGAFRRSDGFTSESTRINDVQRRRFRTLFMEGAALFDCEDWLLKLEQDAARSRRDSQLKRDVEDVKDTLCRLLPGINQIEFNSHVSFYWQSNQLPLAALSDGYRSMFVLVTDILRWAMHHRSGKEKLNEVPGVVLIDEIDSHLHPLWQRQAAIILTTAFPRIQFIVTTHSPFITMSAAQDGLTVLEQDDAGRVVARKVASPRGWSVERVLEAIFGLQSMTDPETEAMLKAYEELRANGHDASELETELNRRMYAEKDSPAAQEEARVNALLKKLFLEGNHAPTKSA